MTSTMTTPPIYKTAAGQAEILALYERVLAAWPVPHQRLTVPTRHGDTFVVASGDADASPLVLLHGSGSNSATWAGDVAHYSSRLRVYAVDIPGEPGKSAPNRFSWDGPAFVEWLDDLLDGLALDRVILGGMSLGGWAALRYGVDRPQRVERLVLIVPSGICQPRLSFTLRVVGLSLLGERGHQRMKRLIFRDAPLTQEAEQFFLLTARHFNFRAGAPPLFTDQELSSLSMPVLYLAGVDDVLLDTRKTAARLQSLLPNVTVVLIQEDGHATINTAPRVLAWLEA